MTVFIYLHKIYLSFSIYNIIYLQVLIIIHDTFKMSYNFIKNETF